jgi:hypothetical protein
MNIYGTVEASCWSKDLGYENYRAIHAKFNIGSQALSEESYKSLCRIFENELEDYYDINND